MSFHSLIENVLKFNPIHGLDKAVVEFNRRYKIPRRGDRWKDMDEYDYEEKVALLALDVAKGRKDLAVAILKDDKVHGGWMLGDAINWIKKNA